MKKTKKKEITEVEKKISGILIKLFPILSLDYGKRRLPDRHNNHSSNKHVKKSIS